MYGDSVAVRRLLRLLCGFGCGMKLPLLLLSAARLRRGGLSATGCAAAPLRRVAASGVREPVLDCEPHTEVHEAEDRR